MSARPRDARGRCPAATDVGATVAAQATARLAVGLARCPRAAIGDGSTGDPCGEQVGFDPSTVAQPR